MKFAAKKGFSLIELMVVVAIIGILSVVGVPKYQVFKAKAITSEATSSLAQVYTVQQAFFMDNDKYATLAKTDFTSTDPTKNTLGYVIPATSKYDFAVTGGDTFLATGTYKLSSQKLASCSKNAGDERTIDENKMIKATKNGLTGC
jgi:prepilin-type N-terminal cleavage/methylation domain-containing protein